MTQPASKSRRLDSWKEIAAFFDRDERTVTRWEKTLGLPIHRLPGAKGRVYAHAEELEEWSKRPKAVIASSAQDRAGESQVENAPSATESLAKDDAILEGPNANPRRMGTVVAALSVLVMVGAAVLWLESRRSASASSVHAPEPAAAVRMADPQARDLYLKGRYYWNKRTADDLTQAVDYFTQAIVRDPGYAEAYVGLAECYNLLPEYTRMPASEAFPRALAAAQKAVELDDRSSEAHASLAFALFYGKWNVTGADREFHRAVELDPNNAVAHHWYATYLMTVRRFSESLAEIEQARTLDPSSTSVLADKGGILFMAGREEQAITLLKQMEATEPSFVSPHRYLTMVYLARRDYPNFLAESKQEALLLHDRVELAITAEAAKGFAQGERGLLQSMLQAQKKFYDQGLLPPSTLAGTYALLDNKDEAFRYLRIACDQHDRWLIYLENLVAFKVLRDDPRYRELLGRMGIPEAS